MSQKWTLLTDFEVQGHRVNYSNTIAFYYIIKYIIQNTPIMAKHIISNIHFKIYSCKYIFHQYFLYIFNNILHFNDIFSPLYFNPIKYIHVCHNLRKPLFVVYNTHVNIYIKKKKKKKNRINPKCRLL